MLLRIFIFLILLSGAAGADEPELLEPNKAFRLSARLIDADHLEVRYQIAPGYYMYRDKFKFSTVPALLAFETAQLPPGVVKKDEIFGEVQTYRGDMRFVMPLSPPAGPESRFTLTAVSQGCADVGVCYPPNEQRVDIIPQAQMSGVSVDKPFLLPQPASSALTAGGTPVPPSEDSLIAELFKGGFWTLVATFFGFGLLLAFTPCMFPMIPILSGILAPHGQHLTRARGLGLSAVYVIGMAITYALAGVAAGLLGTMLTNLLQTSWVLIGFAGIFVALALSMFGLYELQLPGALQSRLTVTANKLHGGHFASVFVMGVLSALIVGPCVAAPLAGALLYISQSGDGVLGGAALFAMALGMGGPLLVVGASAGAILPKSGPWMESVKRFFGVVLLGVAIFLISPLLSATLHLLTWAALLMVCGIFLGALVALPAAAPGYRKVFKGIGVASLLAGVIYIVGALSGGHDVLRPLDGLRGNAAAQAPRFQRVNSVAQLDAAVRAAGGKPVLLDFYADWCVTCKEMERDTFSDRAVQRRLNDMATLQVDVTANTDEHKLLLKRYALFGPPGIVFFDRKGGEIKGLRVVGFQNAEKFAATLDLVLK